MKCYIIATLVVCSLSGCASMSAMQNTRQAAAGIIVDMKDVDVVKYQQDKEECAQYAARVDVSGSVSSSAVGSGLVGALIGGMVGNRHTAGVVGGIAALEGAGAGYGAAVGEIRTIMRQCLVGRGYRVLN